MISWLLKLEDRAPAGPDGQGWNRLAINTFSPTPRCALRPQTRQAALDVARGMAHFGVVTAYAACDGSGYCASCLRNIQEREEWNMAWHIREDDKGLVWLLGNVELGFSGFGYYFKSWSALLDQIKLPHLVRKMDSTGFYWVAKDEPTQTAQIETSIEKVAQ